MSKHEIGYCITRKELLAIFHFTQHFKPYLYGAHIKLGSQGNCFYDDNEKTNYSAISKLDELFKQFRYEIRV